MQALQVQMRVLKALILRETMTLYGHSKLGYLWAIIEPSLMIGILWFIFMAVGRDQSLPFGIGLPVFLLSGLTPWLLFSSTISKILPAIRGNLALLSYPQVTPLDIMVARAVLDGVTKLTVCSLLLGILAMAGQIYSIYSLQNILGSLALAWLLGVGVGICGAAASVTRPSVTNFINSCLRVLFFISGIFFNVDMLPFEIRKFMLFNPLLHVVELARSGFSPSHTHIDISVYYPLGFVSVLLFLAFPLERMVRGRIERL